ncbi:hypothetical protein V1514DRAFT_342520 [Lipomyces japonicus]|uniref:uncharacterized protein n=1 Tax=Lipomyces japonicus TaxID=56871 RepID=UPI0034CD365D
MLAFLLFLKATLDVLILLMTNTIIVYVTTMSSMILSLFASETFAPVPAKLLKAIDRCGESLCGSRIIPSYKAALKAVENIAVPEDTLNATAIITQSYYISAATYDAWYPTLYAYYNNI